MAIGSSKSPEFSIIPKRQKKLSADIEKYFNWFSPGLVLLLIGGLAVTGRLH
jgi:hypothetical protein